MFNLLFTFLVSTPLGNFLLAISMVSIIILIFFCIKRGYSFHKDEKGKWHVEPEQKKKKNINTDDLIKRTNEDIKIIIEDSSSREKKLKEETKAELLRIQEAALKNSIEAMVLEYPKQLKNEEKIDEIAEILELYLKRDFITVVSNKLEMIKNSTEFLKQTELNIAQQVPVITEEIAVEMKNKIRHYILLGNKQNLVQFFDDSRVNIKNTLDTTLKSFLRLSLEEQNKIKELYDERLEKIEQKIKSMYGE
jgi:hypothetical protein